VEEAFMAAIIPINAFTDNCVRRPSRESVGGALPHRTITMNDFQVARASG
jgi:hypothetical protein